MREVKMRFGEISTESRRNRVAETHIKSHLLRETILSPFLCSLHPFLFFSSSEFG